MAIGDVTASGGISVEQPSNNAGRIRAEYGSGLASAIGDLVKSGLGYLQSEADIADVYDRRAMASQGVQAETAFVDLQARRAERFTEFSRDRSASPLGMTSAYDAELEGEEKAFLDGLNPRLREEYAAKLAQDRSQRRTSMFRSELDLLDAQEETTLNAGITTLGGYLKSGQLDLEGATAQWEDLVGKSGLPPAVKQDLELKGRQTLQHLQFGTDIEYASMGFGTTGAVADGHDVVAAGLSPMQRALLNSIAATESPDYSTIAGGGKFDGFSDHPRQYNAALDSTAAGRYMFIKGTWDAARASYEATYGVKVPDFSPEWQDRVALHWAEVQYNRRRPDGAPNFAQIMASGDDLSLAQLRMVLGGEWEGLKKQDDLDFIRNMRGEMGMAGGGTGPSTGPNPWTDPRYTDLPLDVKVQLANNSAEMAANRAKQEAAQAAASRKQILQEVEDLGYNTGDLSQLAGVLSRYGNDPDVERSFRKGIDANLTKRTSVAEIDGKIAAGEPLLARDKDAFASWFGESSMQGLASGDQTAYARLAYAAQQVGQLPAGAAKAVEVSLASPQTRAAALDFLGRLSAGDSNILSRSGFDDKTLADVEIFRRLAERGNQEEALAQFNQMEETRKTGIVSGTEAARATDKFFEGFDVTSVWDTWLPGDQPRMPLDSRSAGALTRDARNAFLDGMKIYGTEAEAKDYMTTWLKNAYGPTDTGSSRALMKYPPEKFYTNETQGREFLTRNVLNMLRQQEASLNLALPPEGLTRPSTGPIDAVAGAVVSGLTPESANFFTLVTDPDTEKDVLAGRYPTYRLMAHDKLGGVVMLPGRFGGKELFEVGQSEIALWEVAKISETQQYSQIAADQAAAVAKRELEIMAPFFREGEKE